MARSSWRAGQGQSRPRAAQRGTRHPRPRRCRRPSPVGPFPDGHLLPRPRLPRPSRTCPSRPGRPAAPFLPPSPVLLAAAARPPGAGRRLLAADRPDGVPQAAGTGRRPAPRHPAARQRPGRARGTDDAVDPRAGQGQCLLRRVQPGWQAARLRRLGPPGPRPRRLRPAGWCASCAPPGCPSTTWRSALTARLSRPAAGRHGRRCARWRRARRPGRASRAARRSARWPSAPTAACSCPRTRTASPASGTRRPLAGHASCGPTARPFSAPPSAPTARSSRPRARTARSGCGSPPAASRWPSSAGTPAGPPGSHSARTARGSVSSGADGDDPAP